MSGGQPTRTVEGVALWLSAHDALSCNYAFDLCGTRRSTTTKQARQIIHSERDEYAATTHDRATTAWTNGLFDNESI